MADRRGETTGRQGAANQAASVNPCMLPDMSAVGGQQFLAVLTECRPADAVERDKSFEVASDLTYL